MSPEQPLAVSAKPNSIDPQRIKAFARFFKNCMSTWSIVAAALPIPAASFRLVPSYKAQTSLLSTYTSLFCFLLLAFIFYSRHQLARWLFPKFFPSGPTKVQRRVVAILPAVFIVASLVCVFCYHAYLNGSVVHALNDDRDSIELQATERLGLPQRSAVIPDALSASMSNVAADHSITATSTPSPVDRHIGARVKPDMDQVLRSLGLFEIPYSHLLMAHFMGIFVFAEIAFILMAIKEYLQDLVGLSEIELIGGRRNSTITGSAP
jgi:hypothetical protein